ncbi:hypothetical protein ACGFY7_41625 [Streptomyces prunicolor]|uniref:hypothetical protein n=1 Tax=Streptomyces prunicolor TaxID=67348 RepID=UPI00370F93AD
MSDENTTDNIHVTDEPAIATAAETKIKTKTKATTDNIHVTDEPLTVAADGTGTATTDNIHVTDEEA